MGATAAIVMHYGGNDWAMAQIYGLKEQLRGAAGLKSIAETDAGFDTEQQVSDIETVLARECGQHRVDPDGPVATAGAFKEAPGGCEAVFMDNVPEGWSRD